MKKTYSSCLFLLVIFLCCNTASYSQENYKPGKILTLSGDTIKGFIDFRNWIQNPKKISFRKTLNDQLITYTPESILSFYVGDDIYESAIVKLDPNSYNQEDLTYSNTMNLKIDTVFLQTMIKGEKSLYNHIDNSGKENFFIKEGKEYELLVYQRYFKDVADQKKIIENKKYIGQLSIYFQNCPTALAKLSSTKYEPKSLLNLFSYYYNCTNTAIGFKNETKKISNEFGLIVGVTETQLSFGGSASLEYLKSGNFSKSYNFTAGLFYNLIFGNNQGKWSLNNELLYTSYKTSGSYLNYVNVNNYTNTNSTLGFSYIKMNNMLRFKFPIKNIFIFLNIGMSNGYAISQTNTRKDEIYFFNTRVATGKALEEVRKYEQGYFLGLGGKYKNYSIEMRYETGTGMSKMSSLSSSTNRYAILLGYRFK